MFTSNRNFIKAVKFRNFDRQKRRNNKIEFLVTNMNLLAQKIECLKRKSYGLVDHVFKIATAKPVNFQEFFGKRVFSHTTTDVLLD